MPIAAGTENRYSAEVPLVEVTVVFQDDEGKPIADEEYRILGLSSAGAEAPSAQTKDDGIVVLEVPVTSREVSVEFPRRGTTYVVRIGDMDRTRSRAGS